MKENRDNAAQRYARVAEALRGRGFLVSDWRVAESPEGGVAPLWVRPTTSYGNACCQVVDDLDDFSLAAVRVRKSQPEASLLLQPVLRGPTYRVIGFKYGRDFLPAALLRERMMRDQVRVPMVLQMPCGVPDRDHAQLLALATTAGNALPVAEAPAEVEIVWTEQGPTVTDARVTTEVDPWNVQLVRLALGLDMEQAHAQLRAGYRPNLSPCRTMAAVIHWLTVRTGLVLQVQGVETARAMPGVEAVQLQAMPGHTLRHVVDTATRAQTGYIIVSGPNLTEALRHMDFAIDRISITASKMTGPPSA